MARCEARALHVCNELVTPEVHYESWREFAELVYAVQDRYCACVQASAAGSAATFRFTGSQK